MVQSGGYLCLVHPDSEVVGRDVSFTSDAGETIEGVTYRQQIDFLTKDFVMAGAWHKVGFVRKGDPNLPERLKPGVYVLQARWRLGDDGALAFDRVRMVQVAALGDAL